jgi:predicted nucleic acid-binding Zn ribbon protein
VSDLERIRVESVTGRRAPAPDPVLASVRERWAEVVGEAVARHAVPGRVSADALVVTCSSAAWASELALLAPVVGERLEAALGLGLGLRFEVGDVPAPTEQDAATGGRPAPSPAAEERARALTADVAPQELRASLERAIARTLRD